MTRDEAMAEAKRRWGADAEVYAYSLCTVGFRDHMDSGQWFFHQCGLGDSFESAFADADKRAREGK